MGSSTNYRKLDAAAGYTALALVLCLFGYFFLNVHDLTDDAYIFLRYAKNFIEGKGLVFNAGERVEGYSSFLWVMLVSALMKSGMDPVLSVKVLGLVFGAGVLVMLFALSRRILGDDVPGVFHAVPAALLVSYRFFDYWCAQGLENPLYIFLLLGGMYCYLSGRTGNRRYIAPAVFGLLALTRIEGAAFFGITFLHRLVMSRRRGSPLTKEIIWALPFLAVFMPFLAWRYFYYGYLLPNTYYAKTSDSMMQVTEGWRFLQNSISSLGALKYPLAVLPLIPLFAKSRPRGYFYFAIITAAGFFFILTSGGDIQPFYRFFLLHGATMLIFLSFLSAAWIYLTVKKQLEGKAAQQVKLATAAAVLFLLLFSACVYGLASLTKGYDKSDEHVHKWASIGKWINRHTPPGTVIAVTAAGATPYFSERTTIDMVGLNDEYIAHHPEYTMGETAQEKKYNTRYVLSRKPDIVVFRFSDWPRANCEIDLFNTPEFRENYMPFNVVVTEGLETFYVRMPRPVRGAEEGRRYLKGLGESWGSKGLLSYSADNPEFLEKMAYIGRLNPNMVNHLSKAIIYERFGQYGHALEELELEKRLNPYLPEIYMLGSRICERKGDFEAKKRWDKEYVYYRSRASERYPR